MNWRRIAAGLIVFGISFGYVEAAVVVYLRAIYGPPQSAPAPLTPAMMLEQMKNAPLVKVEVGREAATIIMLAAVGLLTGPGVRWLPSFAIAFGTWDLFYYVFLKILVDWPASLFTWDVLFLIPAAWLAPVLAPCLVSITIIAAGILALARPFPMRMVHWSAITLGCGLILWSFLLDYGSAPARFAWELFGAGEWMGVVALLHAFKSFNFGQRANDVV